MSKETNKFQGEKGGIPEKNKNSNQANIQQNKRIPNNSMSFKEKRIRKITQLYYSQPEIQKAIFEFSKNREISPRYFEGFGKRPDAFQYPNEIFALAQKGATSFHCSEELWEDPLKIETGMSEQELNEIRIGWDLLIDIDCKWFDYSKKAAEAVVKVFNDHGINNIGVKFSGGKGFHILLPWNAIPRVIGNELSKNMFPELPRKLITYIRFKAEQEMIKILPKDFYEQFKDVKIKKGIKCNSCREIAEVYEFVNHFCPKCKRRELRRITEQDKQSKKQYKCPDCRVAFKAEKTDKIYECKNCNISSKNKPGNFSTEIEIDLFEVLGLDLILVSPRHLFRMPYSLHEKTALASVVISPDKVSDFEMKDANAMKAKIRNFSPKAKEGEAKELIREALDWTKNNEIKSGISKEKIQGKYANFKPIKLVGVSENQFPPCINKILKGMVDGKKRALFVLINFFRSIGLDKDDMEKKILDWNQKNNPPLKQGYITSQLTWSYKRKPLMPPNCREYYQGMAVCVPDHLCNTVKNPVNYIIKKNFASNKSGKFKKSNKSIKSSSKKNNKFKKKN